MYVFFTIGGIIFVSLISIIIYFIYDIFPISKVTNFLNPIQKSLWNDINITVIPILTWALIELPVLGLNNFFIISIISNLCISSAVIYVIKYGYLLIKKEDNNLVNLISIVVSSFFGFILSYFILKISNINNYNLYFSIGELLVLIGFVFYLKIFPPKTFFFAEKK